MEIWSVGTDVWKGVETSPTLMFIGSSLKAKSSTAVAWGKQEGGERRVVSITWRAFHASFALKF